jgi:hypothetical protein
MHPLLPFLSIFRLSLSFALPSPPSASFIPLIILDTGVGHRSSSVPRWRTSLCSISTSGSNVTVLQEYGPAPSPNQTVEPIGARDVAYSRVTSSLFLATGDGILRISVKGSNAHVVVDREDVQSVAFASKCGKVSFSTTHDDTCGLRISMAQSSSLFATSRRAKISGRTCGVSQQEYS